MTKTPVSLIRCTSYETAAVADGVRRAIDIMGGIHRFVRPGEKILLKPNLLAAREPERGITTHPEIVRAVARLVKEAGAIPMIGDSPGGAIKGVERVWEKTGMKQMADEEGVRLINFETAGALEKRIDHPGIPSVHISRVVLEADGIINLPKLKTHSLMILTCAIKNFYGCVPGLRKGEYHKMAPLPDDFGRLLAEIYLLVKDKVRFTLTDGIVAMEGNGPSSGGDLRKLDMIAASPDALALDSFLAVLLGLKPEKIDPLRYLAQKGGGEGSVERIEAFGDSPASFNVADFRFPSNWHIKLLPPSVVKFLGRFVWIKPEIIPEICENCLLCVNSCPVKSIHRPVNGGKPVVDRNACISCLCCHELCPYNAVSLKASILTRLFMRD